MCNKKIMNIYVSGPFQDSNTKKFKWTEIMTIQECQLLGNNRYKPLCAASIATTTPCTFPSGIQPTNMCFIHTFHPLFCGAGGGRGMVC